MQKGRTFSPSLPLATVEEDDLEANRILELRSFPAGLLLREMIEIHFTSRHQGQSYLKLLGSSDLDRIYQIQLKNTV